MAQFTKWNNPNKRHYKSQQSREAEKFFREEYAYKTRTGQYAPSVYAEQQPEQIERDGEQK